MRRLAIVVILAGCRPAATEPSTPPGQGEPPAATPAESVSPQQAQLDAAKRFATLETRLLDAERMEVVFAIESTAPVETDLRGILRIGKGGRTLLEATGTFAGVVGTARIECDGSTLRGAAPGGRMELPCPDALQPALVLGLTRMGLLHNVAMIWAAKPPDRSTSVGIDKTAAIEAWVQTTAHGPGDVPDRDALAFAITVDGRDVGDATLVLDGGGLPSERTQVVRFPDGEMRVVERYETFDLGG